MCIHTLRFFHDGCIHQSVVPPTGPGYIPPVKCAPVWQALEWYHSQPSRAPEMYPPPCPQPCQPVWGNESCKGNVRCVFRPGKCDGCNRAENLVMLAQHLCDLIHMAASGTSLADDLSGDLAPPGAQDETYSRYWKARFVALDDWLKSHRIGACEEYIQSTITRLFVEKAGTYVAARAAPFWILFRDFFATRLSIGEHARLSFFFLVPTATESMTASRPPSVQSNRSTAAAASQNLSPGPVISRDCATHAAAPSISFASPKLAHHRSYSDQSPSFRRITVLYGDNRSSVSTPGLQSSSHHDLGDYKQLGAPELRDETHADDLLLGLGSPRGVSSNDFLPPQRRDDVDEEEACTMIHSVGFSGPAAKGKHTEDLFLNVDRERAAERAMAAAKTIYDTLATSDARKDLCDASRGAYRAWG